MTLWFEEGEDQLALPEPVQHHRKRPDVHALRGERNEMTGCAVELGHQDPDGLGPRWYLQAQQLLGGQREDQFIEQRSDVVHPGDVGASLHVHEVLTGLLHAGVQVADDRLDAANDLTLEFDLQAHDPMGGGVLGTHVDDHPLVFGDLVVEDVVVIDPNTHLLDHALLRLVLTHALGAFIRCVAHPIGRFVRGDPHVACLALRLPGGGLVAHQVTWGEDLNCTGTDPVEKSLRSGWPTQSSGSRIRVRSGWPSKMIPNMS